MAVSNLQSRAVLAQEPSGAPEKLEAARLKGRMGDRAMRDRPPVAEKRPADDAVRRKRQRRDESRTGDIEDEGVNVIFDDDEDDGDANVLYSGERGVTTHIREEEDGDMEEGGQETTFADILRGGGAEDEDMGQEYEVDAHNVDAYWVQSRIQADMEEGRKKEGREDPIEPIVFQRKAEEVLALLGDASVNTLEALESRLFQLLEMDANMIGFVRLCVTNRWKIVFCTRLARVGDDALQRTEIEEQMAQHEAGKEVLAELQRTATMDTTTIGKREFRRYLSEQDRSGAAGGTRGPEDTMAKSLLDLKSLSFEAGGHLMQHTKVKLAEGTTRVDKKGYQEIHIPELKPAVPSQANKRVQDMPQWAQAAFVGMKELNPIQSKTYEIAFNHPEESMLLCAPTGAGKTNVAMLTVLAEIRNHLTPDGTLDLEGWKIVYVAPMKALVQEMVANFGSRLKPYGITVGELTGDMGMTRAQIAATQMIVTTPEKWDIVTRKAGDRAYTHQVRLLIIDEIHLLHDDRGPVLEAIVSRTIRQIEMTQQMIRRVALSATLPNYEDVALFLGVGKEGIFFFDNSHRPVALAQQYVGLTEKKPTKRNAMMMDVCYEKVMEFAGKHQVLVFVHARKDTAKTANAMVEKAMEESRIHEFLREDSASREILETTVAEAKNTDLKSLLPHGFGIHHAGMRREDRTLVEELFREQHIQVLVSTATLAWGVNLPAHTVIIKGTQLYNPERGRFVELSALDIMQMMGRAGRPQYDTQGEGIIITTMDEMHYYLSLMNQQLPIESQLISRLPDMLNAEIVLGTIQNVRDGINWLGYTYLHARMRRNPQLYGISPADLRDDPRLEQRRADLVHSAATVLDKANLIRYDRRTGAFVVTDMGRIASYYYISHSSMATYNDFLRQPLLSDIEIFRLFSLSHEFRFMTVREDEKMELQKLLERVPVPIRETIEEPTSKVNVLLQAYISGLQLDGYALMADMVYITQNAGRIMRALYEIVVRRGWAQLAVKCLNVAKMVEKRVWLSHTPLRQFGRRIKEELLKRLERKDFSWERYYELAPADLGDLVRFPKAGKLLYKYIHMLPRLDLSAHVQPITRSLLRVNLAITPDFQFDSEIHGASETFIIMAEDSDGERILHYEPFVLKARFAREEHHVYFTLPIFEPLPPQYFIRVVSERWLWAETVLPISFRHLILPERYLPHTELLDLQPIAFNALEPQFQRLYPTEWTHFNPIQSQVFHVLLPRERERDDNVLIAAPTGSGKTVCLELALLKMFRDEAEDARAVYVAPYSDICDIRFAFAPAPLPGLVVDRNAMGSEWEQKFGKGLGKRVVRLTGETSADLRLLERGQIIICTPEQWDSLSRRWKNRKNVTSIRLFLVDELHLISGEKVIVSRMRFISCRPDAKKLRIVAASGSLANARELGEWIGANEYTFNFHPSVRPVPLDIHIQGVEGTSFKEQFLSMLRPCYLAIRAQALAKPSIVFTPSRKMTYQLAIELVAFCKSDANPHQFLHCSPDQIRGHAEVITDKVLRDSLEYGIVFDHEGLLPFEREIGAAGVFITAYNRAWATTMSGHLVIVMGTQYYDGREHRHVDYNVADVLQMIGRTSRPLIDTSGVCVVMCNSSKKEYFKRFLLEPLPIESHLHSFLPDHMNAEVASGTIVSKQDAVDYITWTFLYRRLQKNPNYYNLVGVTYEHLWHFLSDLVEITLGQLSETGAGCVSVKSDDEISALNLGIIAAYYYVQFTTIELFAKEVRTKSRIKRLIEILSAAGEFDDIPIRQSEERRLTQLAQHVKVKIVDPDFSDPHVKANVLLQCHFGRRPLPPELDEDRRALLGRCPPLVQALVDVIASSRWLTPALAAMELSQMVTQGLWVGDGIPALEQLPHMTREICEDMKREDVMDVSALADKAAEKDWRDEVLVKRHGFDNRMLVDLSKACSAFPLINVGPQLEDKDGLHANGPVTLVVSLERDLDPDEPVPVVVAPRFPKVKDEGWWLVIGDPKKNLLYSLKRIVLQRQSRVRLDFIAPKEPGRTELKFYVMSDCYVGCDQEFDIEMNLGEAIDDDDEDDEAMGE